MTSLGPSSVASSSRQTSPTKDGPRKKKPTVSHTVEATLSASIEENHPAVFLTSFAKVSDRHYLPTPQHLQTLLYLCLHPPPSLDPFYPISILHRLRSLHTPVELASLIPRIETTRALRDNPPWLFWSTDRTGDASTMHKQVERAMRACVDKGIWELLWDVPLPKTNHRGLEMGNGDSAISEDDEEVEEDEEEEEVEQRLSTGGWDILEWLIDVWETDQRENVTNEGRDYSNSLLQQLPPAVTVRSAKPSSGQQTNASAVMAVIRAAYSKTYDNPFKYPTRPVLATRLFTLLFNATTGPSPPFSQNAFLWSLLPMLRILPPSSLNHLLKSIGKLPWTFRTHLLALLTEEIAGTRTTKASARSSVPSLDFDTAPDDQVQLGCEAYPPPRLSYVLRDLLRLPTASPSTDETERMGLVKLALLEEMVKRHPRTEAEWQIVKQEGYVSSLKLGSEHSASATRIIAA